jgi:hypothetical protein
MYFVTGSECALLFLLYVRARYYKIRFTYTEFADRQMKDSRIGSSNQTYVKS